MTRPITAGVDGSEESLAAPAWAGREAERRGLPPHLAHAWRFEVHDTFDAGDRGTRRQWVCDGLAEAVRTVTERHPNLPVTTDVEDGAVPALLAAAAESKTPVLGSRGYARYR